MRSKSLSPLLCHEGRRTGSLVDTVWVRVRERACWESNHSHFFPLIFLSSKCVILKQVLTNLGIQEHKHCRYTHRHPATTSKQLNDLYSMHRCTHTNSWVQACAQAQDVLHWMVANVVPPLIVTMCVKYRELAQTLVYYASFARIQKHMLHKYSSPVRRKTPIDMSLEQMPEPSADRYTNTHACVWFVDTERTT